MSCVKIFLGEDLAKAIVSAVAAVPNESTSKQKIGAADHIEVCSLRGIEQKLPLHRIIFRGMAPPDHNELSREMMNLRDKASARLVDALVGWTLEALYDQPCKSISLHAFSALQPK